MADDVTKNLGQWKPGQTGNPSGRPPKNRLLTEFLRLKAVSLSVIGDDEITNQEAVAEALWHLAVTGEVHLAGTHLVANSVTEWASIVKWLYTYIEPPRPRDLRDEPEMVVRIVHVDKPSTTFADKPILIEETEES